MKIPLRIFLRFLKKEKCFDSYMKACNEDKMLHDNNCPMLEYMRHMGIIDNNKRCNEDSFVQSFDWDEFGLIDDVEYDWWEISENWKTLIKYEKEDN